MKRNNKAQTALEYMLILASVASVTLIGFSKYLPMVTNTAEDYFNRSVTGLAGKPNPCGDLNCNRPHENEENCCFDCGGCQAPIAAIDGGWCAYGLCTESCGGGIKSRECACPSPSAGGEDCDGPVSVACSTTECPTDAECEYSDWSDCLTPGTFTNPVYCDGGESFRTCNCGAGNCAGSSVIECNTQPCQGGNWSALSACDPPCGAIGLKTRTCLDSSNAAAVGNACSAVGAIETVRCYEGPCSVPGGWCAWEVLGAPSRSCSNDCNGGIVTRRCECPVPEAGGDFCDPDVGITTTRVDDGGFVQTCNEQSCTCLPVGTDPDIHSTICPGDADLSMLYVYVPKTLVDHGDCSVAVLPKCQYYCDLGYRLSAGIRCLRNVCDPSDPDPARATICTNDASQVPTNNLGKLAVSSCHEDRKCEWLCWAGTGLVPNSTSSACVCQSNRIWNGSNCVCPATMSWNGSSCVCPSNMVWGGTRCVCPPALPLWNGSRCIANAPPICVMTTPRYCGGNKVATTYISTLKGCGEWCASIPGVLCCEWLRMPQYCVGRDRRGTGGLSSSFIDWAYAGNCP